MFSCCCAVICRHNTMAAGTLLGGAACIGCAMSPAGASQTVLASIGKFGIAASFAIASIYTRCVWCVCVGWVGGCILQAMLLLYSPLLHAVGGPHAMPLIVCRYLAAALTLHVLLPCPLLVCSFPVAVSCSLR